MLTNANNSYLTNVEVYLGKDSDPNENTPVKKSGPVVLWLTREHQGKGHHLSVENFYASPYLFLHLKNSWPLLYWYSERTGILIF